MFPVDFVDLNRVQGLLVTLTLKAGIMACFAAVVALSHRFRRLLLQEKKNRTQWLAFNFAFGGMLLLGFFSRLIYGYQPADLTLEGVFLLGLTEGWPAGVMVGSIIGMFSLLSGEHLNLLFFIIAGIAGGMIYKARPEKTHPYKTFPLPPLIVYRFFRDYLRDRSVPFVTYPLLAFILLDSLRMIFSFFPGMVFALTSTNPLAVFFILLFNASCVGIPLWIWNHVQIEEHLSQSNAKLAQARLEALRRQINPHFLFNTLNTISTQSLTNPERSRFLIGELSGMLRRLFDDPREIIPLKQELEFVDDYLNIEQARYGSRLQIQKEIHPDTEDALIPTMVLQPLVENAVNHGIAPSPKGGQVEITTTPQDGGVIIRVRDDGVGLENSRDFAEDIGETRLGEGGGMKNVEERLRTIYGNDYRLTIKNRPGGGTEVEVFVPGYGFIHEALLR